MAIGSGMKLQDTETPRRRGVAIAKAWPPLLRLSACPRLRLFFFFLALPAIGLGSSATALKRYESGKYESALREYKRLLMEKPDDARLHFNAGTAAFQVNDLGEAMKQLTS